MREVLTPDPYVDSSKKPQGRRLTPVTVDGVIRALRAGVRQRDVAAAFGISAASVHNIRRRATPRLARDAERLAELAALEQELRENLPEGRALDDLIRLVRAGHLLRGLGREGA